MATTVTRLTRRVALKGLGLSAAAALLASCAPAAPTPTPAPAAPAAAPKAAEKPATKAEKVELGFWTGTSIQNVPYTEKAIEVFHQKNPNITVKLTHIADKYREKWMASVAAGDPPDMAYMITAAMCREYGPKGILEPLDEWIKQDGEVKLSDYYESVIKPFSAKGHVYNLPSNTTTLALFVNEGLFEAAGVKLPPRSWEDENWTWDKLLETTKALTKRSGSRVEQWGFGDGYGWWRPIVWSAGGAWWDNEDRATRSVVDSPEGIRALTFYGDLIHKHQVAPSRAEGQTFGGADAMFQAGKLAISPGHYKTLATIHTAITKFKWSARALPRDKVPATDYFANGLVLWSGSKHKQQSWQFIKFITWGEGVLINAGGSGAPAVKHVDYDKAFTGTDFESLHVLVDSAKYGRPADADGTTPKMHQVISEEIDLLILGNKNGKETAESIARQINQLFAEQK
ncbi:MAG: sugar ABC transporter substrate-binding protein [Chloroflexi bacterium]|nr:sugar ABC transporter substrate-binding protein [Chloroflexota bacterium]